MPVARIKHFPYKQEIVVHPSSTILHVINATNDGVEAIVSEAELMEDGEGYFMRQDTTNAAPQTYNHWTFHSVIVGEAYNSEWKFIGMAPDMSRTVYLQSEEW